MKLLKHSVLLILLTAGGTGFANANSGQADHFNEARTYPTQSSSQDAKVLCQQHTLVHQRMSRSKMANEHNMKSCMQKLKENVN